MLEIPDDTCNRIIIKILKWLNNLPILNSYNFPTPVLHDNPLMAAANHIDIQDALHDVLSFNVINSDHSSEETNTENATCELGFVDKDNEYNETIELPTCNLESTDIVSITPHQKNTLIAPQL